MLPTRPRIESKDGLSQQDVLESFFSDPKLILYLNFLLQRVHHQLLHHVISLDLIILSSMFGRIQITPPSCSQSQCLKITPKVSIYKIASWAHIKLVSLLLQVKVLWIINQGDSTSSDLASYTVLDTQWLKNTKKISWDERRSIELFPNNL